MDSAANAWRVTARAAALSPTTVLQLSASNGKLKKNPRQITDGDFYLLTTAAMKRLSLRIGQDCGTWHNGHRAAAEDSSFQVL